MSTRSRFPRISKRTLPRPSAKQLSRQFPPLKVGLYDHGELTKVVTIDDPRKGFVEGFNRDFGDTGLEARIITAGEKAAPRRKAVAQ